MITATPAKFIDFTLAPDTETAEEHVAEAHQISDRATYVVGLSRSVRTQGRAL